MIKDILIYHTKVDQLCPKKINDALNLIYPKKSETLNIEECIK